MIKIKNEGFIGDMFFGGMEDKMKELDKLIEQNDKEIRMYNNQNKKIFACDIEIMDASLISYNMRLLFPTNLTRGWLKGFSSQVYDGSPLAELWYMKNGHPYSKSVTFQTHKNRELAATKMSIVPTLSIRTKNGITDIEGSYFKFGGVVFRIASDKIAVCTTSIGESAYIDANKKASRIYDYSTSDVKQFIDKWFYKSLAEWEEQTKKDKEIKQQQQQKEKELQKIRDYKKFLINKVRGMKLKEYENKQLLQMMNSKLYNMLTPEDRNMNSDLYIEELIKQTQTVDALNKLDETLDNFEKNRNNIQSQNDAPKKKRMKSNRCPNCGAIFSKQDWLNDDETIDCPACGDWFYKEDLMEFYKRNSKGKKLY